MLLIAIASSFWHLGNSSLHDWDEAIYAQVSKEMIATGDWLRPHYEYKVWIDKPPVLMWTTALLFKLFGVHEFWARAASALAGAAVIVLTFVIAASLFDTWTGLISILILMTSYDFVRYERRGMTDVPLTMFVLIAVHAYTRLRDGDPRRWYGAFIAFALAVMTKWLAALIVPVAIGLVFLNDTPVMKRMLHSWHFVAALGIAVMMAASWHVFMFTQYGTNFLSEYVGFHFSRALSVVEHNSGDQYFYLDILNRNMFPWVYLLPFAVALGLYENFSGRDRPLIVVTLALVVFGFYQFSNTKLEWYIVPAYPVLAILTGRLIALATWSPRAWSLSALLTATLVAAMVAPNTRLGSLLFLALIVLFVLFARRVISARIAAAFAFCVLLFFGVRAVDPLYREGVSPVATLAVAAASQNGADREPMIVFSRLSRGAPLFYSGRPILVARSWSDLGRFARKEPTRIIMAKSDLVSKPDGFAISVEAEAGDLIYGWIRRVPPGSQ